MANVNGRSIVNFLFGLLVLGLLIGIGVGVYDAGVQQGLAQAANVPAGAVAPYYGYGYGFHGFFGFGFLGLIFPILFLFLIFGLVRAAFGRGRGWGGGRGYWGHGPWMAGGDPDAWQQERERRMAELHRRLHETGDTTGSPGSGGSSGISGSGGSGSAL
jgi:hypothetical protein